VRVVSTGDLVEFICVGVSATGTRVRSIAVVGAEVVIGVKITSIGAAVTGLLVTGINILSVEGAADGALT